MTDSLDELLALDRADAIDILDRHWRKLNEEKDRQIRTISGVTGHLKQMQAEFNETIRVMSAINAALDALRVRK